VAKEEQSINDENDEAQTPTIERRGNPRRSTISVFTIRFRDEGVMGIGKDVSTTGAYFVTSDEIYGELQYEVNGEEQKVPVRLVRIDKVSNGTLGIAVRFEKKPKVLPP